MNGSKDILIVLNQKIKIALREKYNKFFKKKLGLGLFLGALQDGMKKKFVG